MDVFDPNNIPDNEVQRQHALLQRRHWNPSNLELLAEIKAAEKAAKDAAKEAVAEATRGSRLAVDEAKAEIKTATANAKLVDAALNTALHDALDTISATLNESLAKIRDTTRKSLDAAAETAKARSNAALNIHAATQTQIAKIEKFANDRLEAAALATPNLAPVDLDPTYSEKDLAAAALDSVMWAAFQTRRIMVRHKFAYSVDYSRATTKPPTPLAMWMAEYYVNHPDLLDRLFRRVVSLAKKANAKPSDTVQDVAPKIHKSPDELEAEEYLRSIGKL